MGIHTPGVVLLCSWVTLLFMSGPLGCAPTAGRLEREPARYAPGVAEEPPRAAAAAAPLHRPPPPPETEPALAGKAAERMPACPIFDPFSAEERLRRALEPLMLGNEEQGRQELLLALCQEPDDPKARDLLRQLDVAPERELGSSFVAYRVQPGDSLPSIAKRLLGDPYRFYLLARYNHLPQPGEIIEGQCLRIPGETSGEPTEAAEELARCGEDAEQAGDPTLAYSYFARGAEIAPNHAASQSGLSRVADDAAEVYRDDAVRALREQDLASACWNSDRALEIRPDSVEMVSLHDDAAEIGQSLANALYREALAAYERGDRAEVLANCSRVLELDPDHPGADQLLQQAAGMTPDRH